MSRRIAAGAFVLVLVLVLTLLGGRGPRAAAAGPTITAHPITAHPIAARIGAAMSSLDLAERDWVWPSPMHRIDRPYLAPPHLYGPGHRGIDLMGSIGVDVFSPADGTIAFAGAVAGRGVVTIDHGDGLVTTLEPVESTVSAGTAVKRGQPVGRLAVGGHTRLSTLHFGVRRDGEYINPLLLLGGIPRAVLLPCC